MMHKWDLYGKTECVWVCGFMYRGEKKNLWNEEPEKSIVDYKGLANMIMETQQSHNRLSAG